MNDQDRRRHEMQLRVVQIGVDNAADYAGIAIAVSSFAELTTLTGEVASSSAAQQSGTAEVAQQYEIKDTLREDLRDQMSAISAITKSMEYAFDGIQDKFYFRRNMADADLLARARAFIIEAAPLENDFKAYGMPAGFISDLTAAADAFEASFGATDSAKAEHIAARAEIAAKVALGMKKVRILDPVMRQLYTNNPGKLAAWIAAQHVEKAPSSPKPPPPPPTP